MAGIGARRAAVLGAGIVVLAVSGAARAQVPPEEAAEATEIQRCLCLQREVSQLAAEMAARRAALRRANQRFADLDAQLRRERASLDVNDPVALERYKRLLEERDAAWKDSVGPVWAAANDAVARYNARVREYDNSCAHRLFDSVLMRQIQATLTCQAPGYAPPSGPPEPEYPPPAGYPPPPAPPEAGYPPAPAYPPPPAPPPSEYPPYPPPPR